MNPLTTNLVLVKIPEFRENTVVHEEDLDTSDSGKKCSEREIVECCNWAVKMVQDGKFAPWSKKILSGEERSFRKCRVASGASERRADGALLQKPEKENVVNESR